ncbi:MAG: NAD(P)-dependent oxidoreductase [Pseudomonadota bacterium]
MSDLKISWIGVGKLGSPMAKRAVDAGLDVTVFDTMAANTAPFAKVAGSMAEAIAGADLIVSTIPNDGILRAIALGPTGILATMGDDAVFVDMSTVSPGASAEVAAAADGKAYLRAPVSGSVTHAESGTLTVLASGPKAAYDRATPLFDTFSAAAFHLGEDEQARYLKLVINNMVGSTAALLAESLTLGRKGGLDWAKMIDVIANSAVASPLVKYKAGPLTGRNFDPAFTTTQMIKDIGLVVEAAQSVGADTPLAAETLALLQDAEAAGLGDEDFTATVKVMEGRAGLDGL